MAVCSFWRQLIQGLGPKFVFTIKRWEVNLDGDANELAHKNDVLNN